MNGGDDEYAPTPLEQLADEAGLGYWQLRAYLEAEVERRLECVAESGDVATSGDNGRALG